MDDYEFGYSPEFSGFESFNYDGSDFSGFDGLNIDSLLSSGGIDAGGLDLGSMGNIETLLADMDFGGTFAENMMRGQIDDAMDFGGTYEENMTRGQDDPRDFGGTPEENIGKLKGQTTGEAKYTTDARGNVYKNGELYRAADEVIDPKDDPYKRISTGNADGKVTTPGGVTPKGTTPDGKKGMDPSMMLMLMMLLSQMGKGGGGGTPTSIPALTANRSQLPYSPPSRPGAGGKTYFSPTTYAPRMAAGGIASLGGYSDGGQLLKGPGDGVSDSIPATIGERQPARLADGEFVVPARIVSELGNGSTEAGARKLYAMMKRVEKTRKGAKNIASNTKSDRHLPA
jgi:hypothetical protein